MKKTFEYHRFLDEAGDTTFFGKGKVTIIGTEGVSKTFSIGMVRFNEPLEQIRKQIVDLQQSVTANPLYKNIPSIRKRAEKGGFYFHAKDDIPELRKDFFDLIKKFDFTVQVVIGRKDVNRFVGKHNSSEVEFYADLLSHLMKDKFEKYTRLVLNIAQRGSSTALNNLNLALQKAQHRFLKKNPEKSPQCEIVYNVQKFTEEPLLSVADYLCWTVQRVFEKGETRFYDYMIDKIPVVVDLYDKENFKGGKNYYTPKNPLTAKNEISP